MFTENMIAPCGLDCSLCVQAHEKENPCPGCTGPDANKPEFCSVKCTIIQCEIRKQNHFRFCDECPQFPCAFLEERENRYMTQYALRESPLSNLKMIRESGMQAFLQKQKEQWSCACGGVISVHEGICNNCGKKYGRTTSGNV